MIFERDNAETPWRVAVTYDNDRFQDGAGAQLLRIYGVYAISRLLGVPYIHSPLRHVGNQGFKALVENSEDDNFCAEFNGIFKIDSDVGIPLRGCAVSVEAATLEIMSKINEMADSSKEPMIAKITGPFGITDRYPDIYNICKPISPFASYVKNPNKIRVALHVRRGDLFFHAPERFIPSQYYIRIALRISEILSKIGIPYQIELHTEVATKETAIPPERHGSSSRAGQEIPVSPSQSSIEEFDVIPNLVGRINEKSIECLSGLATADILVTSISAFSYLAGVLSGKNSIVMYYPFFHSPLSSWITVGNDGGFDEERFVEKLARLLGERLSGFTTHGDSQDS